MYLSSSLSLKSLPLFSTTTTTTRSTQSQRTPSLISCRASTNLYQVLSLESEKVGFDEIKKAYRSMARQYHPDVVPASQKQESTKMFVELQRAYETLSDPILRQQYDYELGLGYLSGTGMKGTSNQDWRRQVWVNQLRGLEMRGHDRKGRKRRTYM